MLALAKFQVEKTVFGAAVKQLLVHAGVDAGAVSEGDAFSVAPKPGSDAFIGLGTVLAVLGSDRASKMIPAEPPQQRAAVLQWCSVATQVAAAHMSLADVDARIAIPAAGPAASAAATPAGSAKGFIAGTAAPSAADLLLLSSLKAVALTGGSGGGSVMRKCKDEAPMLFKWAQKTMAQDALCKQFGPSDADSGAAGAAADGKAGGAAAAADGKGGKGGGGAMAMPSAAEIAARRAEKERLKKEKAEKEAAAKAAGGGGGDDAAAAAAASTGKGGGGGGGGKKGKDAAELVPDELDLRVGQIQTAVLHPTADRLYIESIDVGEEKPRQIVSGLVGHHTLEELQGRHIVVICNMKPRKLVGTESCGMVLCASTPEAVKLVAPPAGCKAGDRIAFGTTAAATAAAEAAKTIPSSTRMGLLLEHLHSDEAGTALWKDQPLLVNGQPVTAAIKNAPIK